LRPEGVVTYVEREQAGKYAEIILTEGGNSFSSCQLFPLS
jgi:hypothetical protein